MNCTCGREMHLTDADVGFDVWMCWKPWGCGRKLTTLPLEEEE